LQFIRSRRSPIAKYVDGFTVPVLKSKAAAYQLLARPAREVCREHGALDYVEPGKLTSFPQGVKLKSNEVV